MASNSHSTVGKLEIWKWCCQVPSFYWGKASQGLTLTLFYRGMSPLDQRNTPTSRTYSSPESCSRELALHNIHKPASMAHASICLNQGKCASYKPEEWSRSGCWWRTGEWALTEWGSSAWVYTYVHVGCNENVKGSGYGD